MNELPLWALGVIGTVIFFVLMYLRMHVGLALMIAGFIGIWLSRGLNPSLNTLATTVWRVTNSTYLVVIPLFVLMGVVAGRLGVTKSAFSSFNSWVGHLRGGLAMTTVCTCAAFGAVCGDNIATAMTMDKAALPEMRKYGYHDSLVFGSIAAGGNLGILIPPSTAFVVFGFITETSIAGLFIAGILPGILLTLMLCSQIAIQCKINPRLSSVAPKVSLKERLISLKGFVGIFVVFALVMGGLLMGLFTPTEAGAAGTLVVIIVGLFYREVSIKDFLKSLGSSSLEATKVSAMILLLIFGAQFFSHFLTLSEIAPTISNGLVAAGLSKYIVMILVCVMYLILGSLMDIWSIMIITLPIFFPVLTGIGFDPLQLGVLTVLCIMIGCITPPVGVVVYSLAGLHPEVPMYKIFNGCWPFVATMSTCLLILIFLPALSTALPNLMFVR